MSWDKEAFREKLESQHVFPGKYNFKFIVPQNKKEEVIALLPDSQLSFKKSSNGKYISITAVTMLDKSQEVLDIYSEAHKIEGCMAL